MPTGAGARGGLPSAAIGGCANRLRIGAGAGGGLPSAASGSRGEAPSAAHGVLSGARGVLCGRAAMAGSEQEMALGTSAMQEDSNECSHAATADMERLTALVNSALVNSADIRCYFVQPPCSCTYECTDDLTRARASLARL